MERSPAVVARPHGQNQGSSSAVCKSAGGDRSTVLRGMAAQHNGVGKAKTLAAEVTGMG